MTYKKAIEGYYLMLNGAVIENTQLDAYIASAGVTATDPVDHTNLSDVYTSIVTASTTVPALSGYGSTGDFVEAIYQHVLDRASDASGKAYWTARIDGGLTEANFVKAFTQSALKDKVEIEAAVLENDITNRFFDATSEAFIGAIDSAAVDTVEASLDTLENKIAVSEDIINTFAGATYDSEAAAEILNGVTNDAATVTAAANLIDDVVTASADLSAAYALLDSLNINSAADVTALEKIVEQANTTAASNGTITGADIIAAIDDIDTEADTVAADLADGTLDTAVDLSDELIEALPVNEVASTNADETLAGTDGVDNFTYDFTSNNTTVGADNYVSGQGIDGTDTITGFVLGTDTITFNDNFNNGDTAVSDVATFGAMSGIDASVTGTLGIQFLFNGGTQKLIIDAIVDTSNATHLDYITSDNDLTVEEAIQIIGTDKVSFTSIEVA